MRSTLRMSILFLAVLSFSTISCSASHYIKYSRDPRTPAIDGRHQIAALHQPVKVTWDSHHVPHIYAQNDDDLWYAVGWIQARERLFQMDTIRRMAGGRMSELLGNQNAPEGMPVSDLVSLDRFFRVMNLAQDSARQAAALNPESRRILESYVSGINAYMVSGEPLSIEYALVEAAPAPWTVADVLTVARLTTFELSTNFPWEMMRFVLAAVNGPDAQQDIHPGVPQWGPHIIEKGDHDFTSMPRLNPDPMKKSPLKIIVERGEDLAQWAPAAGAVLETMANVQDVAGPYFNQAASNSWAVSGAHSASGKAILANDPHLLHMAPGTFMIMHLNAPGIDTIGAVLPGTPLLLLGRNQNIGWASTNTFADVQDIYLEKLDPNDPSKYLTENGPVPFHVEREVIRERVGKDTYKDHVFELRYTRHGAVLNDSLIEGLPADAQPIALKTAAVWPADEVAAVTSWIRAKSVKEFRDSLKTWGLPIQNWVAADDQGNIGYFPLGLVPLRRTFDGTVPVPGWTGEYEWTEYIPFDQLPQMYNPPSGIIVTANNQVVPAEDYPYPYSIDTMPGYRAARIRDVLTSRDGWTGDDFRKLHMDTYVKQAERLMPDIFKALEGEELTAHEKDALNVMKDWNLMADTDSIGASVFFTTYREAWNIALNDDLPVLFKRMVRIFSITYGFFDTLWADSPNAKVWDVKGTPAVEDRDDVLVMAFKDAVKKLDKVIGHDVSQWQWGKLHTITFHHAFGSSIPRNGFDVGPFPTGGSWETVWAAGGGFWGDYDTFPVSEGPAFRQVLDFASPENCNMIVDLGQSGWPQTPEYSNAFQDWNTGNLWNLSMNPDVFTQGATGVMELVPAN